MSRNLALAAAAVAALGLTAFALPASAAVLTAAALSQDPITEADVEARAEAFGTVMGELNDQIGAIREDDALSDADKNTRIDAAIAAAQPEIDAFAGFIEGYIRQEIDAGNIPADQADGFLQMVRAQFAQIPIAMKSGDFSGMTGTGG